MSTTFTLIGRLKSTSASHLFLTIGIVVSKVGRQELPNPMIQTKRSESALREKEIFAMSKSRSQSTSRVLCYGQIFNQMEAHRQIHPKRTTFLRKLDLINNNLPFLSTISISRQIIQAPQASDTMKSSVSMETGAMARVMALRDLTSMIWREVMRSKRTVFFDFSKSERRRTKRPR